jgi:hypothetical protein
MKTDTKLRSKVDAVEDEEFDGFKASAVDSEIEDCGAVQEGWVAVVNVSPGLNEAGYKVGEATTGSPEKDGVLISVEIGSEEGGKEAVETAAGGLK